MFLSIVLLVITACDRPICTNTNPIISSAAIESDAYITELHKLITNSLAPTNYWFSEYVFENGKDYIILHIQSENICAKGKFLVTNWSGMEGIERTNGTGYRGAKLRGFKYKIDSSQDFKVLVFCSVERIID